MSYFDKYVSNTLGASANQTYFETDGEVMTTRVFYKIFAGGEYGYSFLYTNLLDSSILTGEFYANRIIGEWDIISAGVAVCRDITNDGVSVTPLTFGGKTSKHVAPGEFFATDEVTLAPDAGDYVCVELTFAGKMLPMHMETELPVFVKTADGWERTNRSPLPGYVGCDRTVKKKVTFLGDSITQGEGTTWGAYAHYAARVADAIGRDYAFLNAGIGYGRASDSASGGAWLYKASKCDVCTVCFGVNDIFGGHSAERIKSDLVRTVDLLHAAGAKVLLQTTPPFDMTGADRDTWLEVNRFIKEEMPEKCEAVFDCVPILSADGDTKSRYGSHPNDEGHAAWAKELAAAVAELLA